jgi:hypothetical protein
LWCVEASALVWIDPVDVALLDDLLVGAVPELDR